MKKTAKKKIAPPNFRTEQEGRAAFRAGAAFNEAASPEWKAAYKWEKWRFGILLNTSDHSD